MEKVFAYNFVFFALSFAVTNGAQLFGVGQEYKYNYEALVITGSEEPTSFASAYKLLGILKVASVSTTTLSVSIDELSVGLYNGPWTYFPIPDFKFISPAELAPLGERFHIVVEDGKFKTLIMNDQEPEWASNMKRGLATYLQMDLKSVKSFNDVKLLNVSEMTTMGECPTKYEVIPGSTTLNRLTRVSKFRNHADCPDLPKRARIGTDIFYSCTDQRTEDIVNSTSYSTYEFEINDGQPLLKNFNVYSSLLFWPFTTKSSYRYSWLNMTLTLMSHSNFGNQDFPAPENPENHEDLSYVFEQSDPTDTEDENLDLKSETIFFHHISVEPDEEFHDQTQKMFQEKVSELAESLLNSKDKVINENFFQGKTEQIFLALASSLDYDHLTQCYQKYSAAAGSSPLNLIEYQFFIDGLVLAGTSPASLVLRDILLATDDIAIQFRIAPLFPNHIRNPSEALAKEMDEIFSLVSKPAVSLPIRRIIEFSMATLIGRCCKKTLCVTSGLLDKYIDYFENKLKRADNFEDRTAAIIALGNIGQGQALDKILDIASGKLVHEQTVRVQSIWAVRSLAFHEHEKVFGALLPVFFNRSESCEIRTTIFNFLMSVRPEKRLLHEIAYFMWTETCPQTMNIVRSFLTNAVKSQSPCNKIGQFARTILTYLPPGVVDPIRTSMYAIDYYDKQYGFGHQIKATVQKSGKAALPVSVYVGMNNYIAGYGSSYVGVFIRMEGIENEIANKLSELRNVNIAEIQKILSKIGVTQRSSTPLRLEFTFFYHGHAISYYAADEKTLANIPIFLKKLTQLKESMVFNWERTMDLGGIFYQQPLEIGTPLSVFAGVTGIESLEANFTRGRSDDFVTQDSSTRLQYHLFGHFQIANHAPAIGTMHTISSYRTFRVIVPRRVSLKFDMRKGILHMDHHLPTNKNPLFIMTHSTSETSLLYDSPSRAKDHLALEMLKKSCPHCSAITIVSRGNVLRKTRVIPVELPSFIKGVRVEAKYYDCERDHSRATSLKKIGEFFSDNDQNTGFFDLPLSKLFLSIQHARHYTFIAPYPETCGISLLASQDDEAPTKLNTVTGKVQVNLTKSTTFSLLYALNLKYSGVGPSSFFINTKLDILGINNNANIHELNLKIDSRYIDSPLKNIICVNVTVKKTRFLKDRLSLSGENEPIIEEKIQITEGKIGDDCPTDQADILITGRAQRSIEQIEEANSSGLPSFAVCRGQTGSKSYPGSFVPASSQCFETAIDQTNLRSGNATISYKVSEEVHNIWKRPITFLTGILQPYATESPADESQHKTHKAFSKNKNIYEGEIELDIQLNKYSSSTMDIHYRRSNQEKEEHFHDVDLNLLPENLKLRPVPSRFSPLWQFGLKLGVFSACTVYPGHVQTLDGFAYAADLSDCPTLISADCGKKPQYSILAKRVSSEKLVLTVLFGENKIDLDGSNNVVVNGKRINLPDRESTPGNSSNELSSFVFLKNGDEINIDSFILGVHIRYTGSFVTVVLSSRYRAVHCGLCGHWDSTYYNDMVGPDPSCRTLLTPENMVKAYVIREGSCSTMTGSGCPA